MHIRVTKRSLGLPVSLLLHAGILLPVVAYSPRQENVEKEFQFVVTELVEFPDFPVNPGAGGSGAIGENISHQPAGLPQKGFSSATTISGYEQQLRAKLDPSLKVEGISQLRSVSTGTQPGTSSDGFSMTDYRKQLENKIGNAGGNVSAGTIRSARRTSGTIPAVAFSSEGYRKMLESKLGAATQGNSSRPVPKQPTAYSGVPAGTASSAISMPSPVAVQTGFLPASYLAQVKKRITDNWALSELFRESGDRAVISFRIARDGNISNPVLERPARSKRLNESALDAIKASSPFQALPESFKQEYLEVVVEFSMQGVR